MTHSFLTKETKTKPLQFYSSARFRWFPIKAFTLAETLITLTIIGIIAALTVPNLLSKYNEQVTINKVKKFHSTLTQALPQAIKEYGTIDTWDLQDANKDSTEKIYQQLIKPYFKIAKDCGIDNTGNCLANVTYKQFDGKDWINYAQGNIYYKFLLADGSAAFSRPEIINNLPNNGTLYINLGLDTNGKRGPNQWGKDIFMFEIINNEVYADGVKNSYHPFDTNCQVTGNGWGFGCTAWVIYKGNMDYLRCPEKLSWDGKTSCK